jgi:hypothetical protein
MELIFAFYKPKEFDNSPYRYYYTISQYSIDEHSVGL